MSVAFYRREGCVGRWDTGTGFSSPNPIARLKPILHPRIGHRPVICIDYEKKTADCFSPAMDVGENTEVFSDMHPLFYWKIEVMDDGSQV